MTVITRPFKSIFIEGHSLSAAMTAAYLGHMLKKSPVTVYCDFNAPNTTNTAPDVLTLGPKAIAFNQRLKLNERDLMRFTQATFKLGSVLHPLNHKQYTLTYSDAQENEQGFDIMRRLHAKAHLFDSHAIAPIDIGSVMMAQGKFLHPSAMPEQFGQTLDYGLHVHRPKYIEYLFKYAAHLGVKPLPKNDTLVDLLIKTEANKDSDINGLRRIVASIPAPSKPLPYSTVNSHAKGIITAKPLQNFIEVEFVYDDQTCTTELAHQIVFDHLKDKYQVTDTVEYRALHSNNTVPLWSNNCLTISANTLCAPDIIAAESQQIITALEWFNDLLPINCDFTVEAIEYNRRMSEYLCAHEQYISTFYRLNNLFQKPDGTKGFGDNILKQFTARAHIPPYDQNKIDQNLWTDMFIGNGIRPQSAPFTFNSEKDDKLLEDIQRIHQTLSTFTSTLPDHSLYLQKYAPAKAKEFY